MWSEFQTADISMDCSLLGSSIHGIFQVRVLDWGAIAFSQQNWGHSKHWAIHHPFIEHLGPSLNIKVLYQSLFFLSPNLQETLTQHSAAQVLCSWEMPVETERYEVCYKSAIAFLLQATGISHQAFPVSFIQSINSRLFKQTLEGTTYGVEGNSGS